MANPGFHLFRDEAPIPKPRIWSYAKWGWNKPWRCAVFGSDRFGREGRGDTVSEAYRDWLEENALCITRED